MKKIKLPGDRPTSEITASMLRVNHAGEYGAVRIYQGQLAVLKHDRDAHLISEMKHGEIKHLEFFSKALLERGCVHQYYSLCGMWGAML